MAWQRRAGTQPAEQATAGEHSRQMICPAQASKKQNSQQTLADLAAKQQLPDDVGRPLAVQCRLMEGVRWCWPLKRRAQTYLLVSLPPIAFACHCPYPLPKFVQTQFSPNLFFCYFYFPFFFPL